MSGETDGSVKIVADKKYDEVLGVHSAADLSQPSETSSEIARFPLVN